MCKDIDMNIADGVFTEADNDELADITTEKTDSLDKINSELEEINAQLEEEIAERMKLEEDLRRSMEEIQDLYDNSPCGYHSLDRDGFFIRINETELRWLGYSREELIEKKKFTDVITQDSLKTFFKNYPDFMKRGWVKDLEFEMICKNGTIMPVLLNATAIKDCNGNYIMSRSTIFENTERKKAEEALHALNSDLESMVTERTAQLQEINSELEETNAMLEEEISERIKTEIALRKSEELYRSVYENSPLAFGIWDNEFRFMDWNRRAEELFGWSREEVLGRRFVDFLVPPEIRASIVDVATDILISGIERVTANENVTKDGRILFCEWNNSLLHDENGKLIGVISLGMDKTESIKTEKALLEAKEQAEAANERLYNINAALKKEISDRMEVEAALRRAKTEAEQANIAKSNFLANMSHEIRTPMNGIIGMTDMTLMTDLNEDQREYLNIVKSSTRSLLRVLNDILDYSKIEAGKVDLEKLPFDIRETVNEVMDLFAIAANQKGLYIKLNIDNNIPQKLVGDSVRLRQVLSNLVGNGIKFTHSGGVNISMDADGKFDNNMKLKVVVSDTGIGIPGNKLDKLFKRFSQVDDTNTRQFGGTGLGLAISQKLVEMMDGQIWVESREGEGSSFYFTANFGLVDEDTALNGTEVKKSEDLQIKNAGIKKVLLVEDDEVSRTLAIILLSKKGMQVVSAENGKIALDIYERERFDLILMDVNMPQMDGYTATAAIRAKEKGANTHTPVIAMTAYALSGDREKCIASGMDDYITKPIDINELFRVLDNWL